MAKAKKTVTGRRKPAKKAVGRPARSQPRKGTSQPAARPTKPKPKPPVQRRESSAVAPSHPPVPALRPRKLVASGKVMRAIDEIWRAARRGEYYPASWRGQLSVEEAYLVQLGMLARYTAAGERQAGWKVGLTARAMQQQIGVHEPVLGFLLVRGHLPTGLSIPHASLAEPRIENELCVTLGRMLAGPGVTVVQARAALSAVAPAFEVVENRGNFAVDLPLAIADNVQQRAFITGPEVPLSPTENLAEAAVEVRVNGEMAEAATGAEVLGDPAASIAWLANKLAEFGLKLESGVRVMSGSFTRQVLIRPGDAVEARFHPFGTVSVRFT